MARKKDPEFGPYYIDDDTDNDFEYRDVSTARGVFGVPAGYKMRFPKGSDEPEYEFVGVNRTTRLVGEDGYKGMSDNAPGGIKVVPPKRIPSKQAAAEKE